MKFKIKTNLWSGIIMGLFSIAMLIAMPGQVRLPMFDSGAPSPRIIPGTCLAGTLVCSAALIIQSLSLIHIYASGTDHVRCGEGWLSLPSPWEVGCGGGILSLIHI